MIRQAVRSDLQRIYSARFAGKLHYRVRIWKILVSYFQPWVPRNGAILDLGAGYCEFINHVSAGRKYAMDLNPELPNLVHPDVRTILQDCSEPWPLAETELDTVFTSNFLEHLPHKEAVRQTLSKRLPLPEAGWAFPCLGAEYSLRARCVLGFLRSLRRADGVVAHGSTHDLRISG